MRLGLSDSGNSLLRDMKMKVRISRKRSFVEFFFIDAGIYYKQKLVHLRELRKPFKNKNMSERAIEDLLRSFHFLVQMTKLHKRIDNNLQN